MGNVLIKISGKQAGYGRTVLPGYTVFSMSDDSAGFALCFGLMNLLDKRRGFE